MKCFLCFWHYITIINSDRIILIDDGKIIGEGTHQELMQSSQFYRDLYNNCDVFNGTIEWIDCPNLV